MLRLGCLHPNQGAPQQAHHVCRAPCRLLLLGRQFEGLLVGVILVVVLVVALLLLPPQLLLLPLLMPPPLLLLQLHRMPPCEQAHLELATPGSRQRRAAAHHRRRLQHGAWWAGHP